MLSVRLKGIHPSHDPPQNMLVGKTILQGTVIMSLYASEFVHLSDCQHPPRQYPDHRSDYKDPIPVFVGPKKNHLQSYIAIQQHLYLAMSFCHLTTI